jgi:hypothetical protein
MSPAPRVDLDKLVRRIVLEVSLLKWFATHGQRQDGALSAIELARRGAYEAEQATLDFLEQVVKWRRHE